MPGRVAGAGALALAVAVGLGGVSLGSAPPGPRAAPGESATVTCEEAILGRADPKWRRRSTVAGPFGFYGSGRNLRKWAQRNNQGFLISKIPTIVEGATPVTVRVSDRDAHRAGLVYGFGSGGGTVADSAAEVRFEPCADRSPTGWPGGFVLKNRKAVKFLVQVEGQATLTTISVGKFKRR